MAVALRARILGMHRAGDLLGRVSAKIRDDRAPLAWLASSWPRIVGETIAAHTRPLRFQNGCLEITADAKVWRRQLECLIRDFCSQINQAWGGVLVREVKFAAKPVSGATRRVLPYELDNDHTPFVRRRK